MYIRDPGYLDQLERWGLDRLTGALAFPAQVGPPPEAPQWRRMAGGSTTSCYRLSDRDGSTETSTGPARPAAETLFLKQYRYLPPSWRFLFRASRARREAENLRLFARLGLACPRIVALGESRQTAGGWVQKTLALLYAAMLAFGLLMWWLEDSAVSRFSKALSSLTGAAPISSNADVLLIAAGGGLGLTLILLTVVLHWLKRDYLAGAVLVTSAVEPSQNLRRFAKQRWEGPACPSQVKDSQIRVLAAQLAAQLATVHRTRFVHGDLKWRNLLVCWPRGQPPETANLSFAWIDCPRGHKTLSDLGLTRGRAKDLADLDSGAARVLSRSQRLRFLCDYLIAYGGEEELDTVRSLAKRVLNYERKQARRKNGLERTI